MGKGGEGSVFVVWGGKFVVNGGGICFWVYDQDEVWVGRSYVALWGDWGSLKNRFMMSVVSFLYPRNFCPSRHLFVPAGLSSWHRPAVCGKTPDTS